MKRILIVKLWALGDILMATPLLRALKQRWPDVEIDWLADTDYATILMANPLLHTVIAFDSGTWRRHYRYGRWAAYWRMSRALRRDLQSRRYDAVVNLHADKWWAAWFGTAPVRVGLFARREPGLLGRFYTKAISETAAASPHNTERYLLAATALGCPTDDKRMSIGLTDAEKDWAEQFLAERGVKDGTPVVVLAPFTTAANRCWEPERFAALADWLLETYGARCLLTFSPKEADDAGRIAGMAGAAILPVSGTSLRQYVALVHRADLVICCDSSALHIAGAIGTPYVSLFGATPAGSRAPLAGQGIALAKPLQCAPCDQSGCRNPVFRQCMKLLELGDVQRAVEAILREAPFPERKLE